MNAKKMLTPAILALGVVFGIMAASFGWWSWIEPISGIATLALAGAAWWQTRKARTAVYQGSGDGLHVVALEVGRPVSEAVKAHFGQMDALVRIEDVLGGSVLATPDDYRRMASAVYSAICAGQGQRIKLVLSGPVALACLIGQLVGLHHFDVEVFQYDPASKGYIAVPSPTRDWLDHRA